MQNVRALIESRPRVEPAPDVVGTRQRGRAHQAAVAADGSTLMAYTAGGRDVAVDLGTLASGSAQPWWFDPRTGEATQLDAVEGGDTVTFTPPVTGGDEADWVLVVDDAAAGFGTPGTGRSSGRGPGGTAPAGDRDSGRGRGGAAVRVAAPTAARATSPRPAPPVQDRRRPPAPRHPRSRAVSGRRALVQQGLSARSLP